MNTVTLSDSETRTIVSGLVHEGTWAAKTVLEELQKQGVFLPLWSKEFLEEMEIK